MAEPRIQYAKTGDGVNIAYWTMGDGPPLVVLSPLALGASQAELADPDWRSWYEGLARTHRLIRYDARGSGMSDRASEFPLDAMLADLLGVIDHLALDRVALLTPTWSSVPGVAFAARHPVRVDRLILWRGPSAGSAGSLGNLAEKNWEVFSEVVGHLVMGWDAGAPARRMAAYIRESFTAETFDQLQRALSRYPFSEFLPHVEAPTLVIGRREFAAPVLEVMRDMAASIPNARIALLAGSSTAPFGPGAEMETALAAVEEFLAEGRPVTTADTPVPTGLATILFTDMESSTTLTQQLGDAAAQAVRRAHNDIVRTALNANDGSEIKHTGDGIMATFPSASSALECAIAIQRGVASHKDEHADSPLGVYVGLNAGEPIAEDHDLFGTSVDLAARLVDYAEPGQIIASDVVRQLAAGKDFLFSDLGETELRGFEDPVKLWELRWREED